MARATNLNRSRKIDGYALTAIAPILALFPAWAAATAVFWWLSLFLHGTSYWFFAVVVLLSGVVLFIKPLQVVFLGRLFDARRPTTHERDLIQRSWLQVAQANHIHRSRYVFAVIDTDDLNAFACGGHLVVVSRYALENLTQEELTGVLAHELSHHLGLHTVALTVGQWLSLPIILLARLGFVLQNIADAATHAFTGQSESLKIVGRTISGFLTIISWLFLADLTVAQTIGNVVGKGAEFKADEHAVDMGFGRGLVAALRRVIEQGRGERPTSWRDSIVTSHPPARTRVVRIEARLRVIESRRRS